VQAGNRRLTLSNLDKQLHPSGSTKGEVINYYSQVADVLLPHLAGRPVTFIRIPDGVGDGKQQFFEKNVPNGAPDRLPTVALPSTGSRSGRNFCSVQSAPGDGRVGDNCVGNDG
jgi:bifunctional non-homologous end joining protein LigD